MPIRLRTQNCGTWRNLCHAIPTRLADTPEGVFGDVLLISDSLTFSTSLAWGSLTGQHLRNHEPSQQMLPGELCSMTKLGNFRRPLRAETTGTRALAGKLLQSKGIDNLAPQRVSSPDGVCAKLRQESRKITEDPPQGVPSGSPLVDSSMLLFHSVSVAEPSLGVRPELLISGTRSWSYPQS